MSASLERCQECGSSRSGWLDDNCPTCLIRLGATATFYEPLAAAPSVPGPVRSLGGYELLEEIARGGMGVVYRARQLSLSRQVAVKVLPGGQFANGTFIKRFRREAEAAASLNHPNIVAIHEVGEHEGQLFFSMQLIEGRSLADLICEKSLPARQAAQLIKTISEAVAFAHGRGLLHRDLKPSNVLLDELGVPHITDFGLAKRSDGDSDLTLTGQILGSPNYMAPEQADPKLGPTTAASDVYSVGAMLYHLLTGRPPFIAETVAQTLRLVAEGGPVPPSRLHPGVSRDLETICLKCLETDAKLRYPSAQALADELCRFLRDEPIRARPVGPVAKLARWCRRKPALASSLSVVAVLLLVVSIGSPIALLRIHGEREASETARKHEAALRVRAETAKHEARRQLYTALLEQADASVHSGRIGQHVKALDAIRRAAAISNSVALRREALTAMALPDLRFERELPGGSEFTLQSIDPVFENVAMCRGSGPVEILAVSDWRLKATLPASTNLPVYVASWSTDGRYLAVKRDYPPGGESADLEVWEMPNPRRSLLVHNLMNSAMSFHPRQHRLITSQVGGVVTTWDLEQSAAIARFQFDSAPLGIKFAPQGEYFAALFLSTRGFIVSVHDAATGTLRASHDFANPVQDLDWHPNGRWVAVVDLGGMVHLMDSRTGETRVLGSHKAQAATVAFTPEGDYLFSGGWEGELICWDMRTMERALTIERQSWTAKFRSDGKKCALVTESGIQLYNFERPKRREFGEDLGPRLRHAAFSRDGRWLAATAEQYVGVWDMSGDTSGALAKVAEGVSPAFTADGKELFASGSGSELSRWRVMPGTNASAPPVLQPVEIPASGVFASVSMVSNLIALTGPRGSAVARLDSLPSNEARWVGTSEGINGISPDGRWLGIYRPFSPFLSVYRLPKMELAATLTNLANISDFVFAPVGNEVAVSSRKGVEFWTANTWTRTHVLTNFTGILYSPDNTTCWMTSDFCTAGLYDPTTQQPLLPLPSGFLPLALSADGRRLAVSVDARHLQVWDLEEVRNQLRELGLDWTAGFTEATTRTQRSTFER